MESMILSNALSCLYLITSARVSGREKPMPHTSIGADVQATFLLCFLQPAETNIKNNIAGTQEPIHHLVSLL